MTDGVTAGTTTITSATAAFGTDVVGNLVYVSGGTGTVAANWYEITVRNSATSITVDRSTGLTSGTGVTLKIGGALKTPGVLSTATAAIGGQLVSGMKAWIQYSATPTACSTGTAGPAGPCSLPSGITLIIEGYDVTRGDRTGNQPIYQWTATLGALTYAYVSTGTNRQEFMNLAVDGNSKANAGGFNVSAGRTTAIQCTAQNCNQSGAVGFIGGQIYYCFATGCTTGFSSGTFIGCVATGGTNGFLNSANSYDCLAYSVPNGFTTTGASAVLGRCTADNCSTAAFALTGQGMLINCLATNSAVGYSVGSGNSTLHNCASYNNITVVSGTPVLNEGPFASGNTLTALGADPYVNQAGADFRPNANNPGGAQLWATSIGLPGQTNTGDIGAVRHSDPAASNLIVCVEC